MKDETWQVQDAKQRLSELLRRAEESPQFVTRHGEEVAVVIDIKFFRELTGTEGGVDFKVALAPHHTEAGEALADVLEEVAAERAEELPREVSLGVGE
ncbi:type II toxin-antitoxin system prevent-host-death family antitoxin [Amycolatopsis sp. NPDC059027]|uniref:type II toxin-antitoxin system prevent-host-death family antitoxin n=1 Tax=unclassified Amycolatopsis TaxID=2618356 RepID=UPI00366FA8FA